MPLLTRLQNRPISGLATILNFSGPMDFDLLDNQWESPVFL